MFKCKNLDIAIWLKANDIDLEIEDKDEIISFYADDTEQEVRDRIAEYFLAQSGSHVNIDYSKLLQATAWIKKKLHRQ